MGDHRDSSSQAHRDIIDSTTSFEEIVRVLVKHKCPDITQSINLEACSRYPCAAGGFCDVYQGELLDTRKTRVAIKSLRVSQSAMSSVDGQGSRMLKQTARELYYWSKLQHSNVLPLRGLAIFREHISMVSEWMDNGNVLSYLTRNPDANRINLCKQICEGLCYLHENQLVHGDLKSANVMMSSNGVAMIADFGNSRRLRELELTLNFSMSIKHAITFRWAAPELMTQDRGAQVSMQADVYAYGMTALEVLSGKVPFEGIDERRIMLMVTNGQGHPSRPDTILDDGLWEALTSCWALSPAQRPPIKAVRNRLQTLYPQESPSGPVDFGSLGDIHLLQFQQTGDLMDLNQAITFFQKAVDEGHANWPERANDLGNAYRCRFDRLGELSDIDISIKYQTKAVQHTPDSHINKPAYHNSLGNSYLFRFERLNQREDLDKAFDLHSQAVSTTDGSDVRYSNFLSDLGTTYLCRFKSLGEGPNITQAIDCYNRALEQTPFGHDDRPSRLGNLGNAHLCQFEHLNDIEELNRAIRLHTRAVNTPSSPRDKPIWLNNLGDSYMRRFEHQRDISDAEDAYSYFRQAAQLPAGHPRARFISARKWARSSVLLRTSPHEAYQRTLELIPQLVWLGTTIDQRYKLLAEIGDIAMEAASSAIENGSYACALEWLDEGRSVVWNQMLQLRTPFEDLSAANPELAKRLEEVAFQLELTGSRPITMSLSTRSVLFMEQNAQYRHALAAEWEELLKLARDIPAFQDFMRPRRATELVRAAKDGPVVVINVHKSRCDALIIKPNSIDIAHVPLESMSLQATIAASLDLESLLPGRGFAARGFTRAVPKPKAQQSLKSMLATLWSNTVKPVLDFLGHTEKLPLPELPHVTWCTTGPLSFFPLHASGSYDGVEPSALDLVVSSYTPTLSALLNLNPPNPDPRSGLLAISQKETPGFSKLPGVVAEIEAIRSHAQGIRFLQLDAEDATVDAVLNEMQNYSWIHLACHGTQNPRDPTRSAFHLHDGGLELATIIKRARSLKHKGLAFLSACQTAKGDTILPDESLHLAAALMMVGYPSVIATKWNIADEDGPIVAEQVYTDLLNGGTMDCTMAARVLHKAVWELRAKVGEDNFWRWASFIHMGV